MRKVISILLVLAYIPILFALFSVPSKEDIEIAKEERYEDGRVDGYDDGYDDGFSDGLFEGLLESDKKGYSEKAESLFLDMLDEAKSYSEEMSVDVRFWEAMDIVSVYLDGYDPDGYPLPTRKEFEEAVEVVFDYAVYLEYNAMEME
jgi:hypothetical protein